MIFLEDKKKIPIKKRVAVHLKRFFPALLAFVLILLPFSGFKAFADSGGLLNNSTLYIGQSIIDANSSTNFVTDSSLSTSYDLDISTGRNHLLWHHFSSPVSISSYILKTYGGSGSQTSINFYDSSSNLIGSSIVNPVSNNTQTFVSTYSNVSYVSLVNDSSSILTVYNFDLFAPGINHDEITALSVSQSGTSANINYVIPSSNSHYSGSKIYRDGSLIATQNATATSYVDSVNYSTSYVYKVTALYDDSFETSGATYNLTTGAIPSIDPVVGLSDSNITDHGVDLTWSAPTSPDLAGFKIYQDGSLIQSLAPNQTSYTVSGLSASKGYKFTVTAFDSGGNESVGSDVNITTLSAPDTIPPDVVTGVHVTPGDSAVFVSWSADLSPDTVGYNIYVNGVLYNTTLIQNTFGTVTGLTNSTSYNIQVSAVDSSANESSLSSAVSATPKAGLMPVITSQYSLQDVSDGISQWFKSYWLILAFATSIPLSFYIASRIKLMFID